MPWWYKKRGDHGRKTTTEVTKAWRALEQDRRDGEEEARLALESDERDRLAKATESKTNTRDHVGEAVAARTKREHERYERVKAEHDKSCKLNLKRLADMELANQLNAERFEREQLERRIQYEEELRRSEMEAEESRKAEEHAMFTAEQKRICDEDARVLSMARTMGTMPSSPYRAPRVRDVQTDYVFTVRYGPPAPPDSEEDDEEGEGTDGGVLVASKPAGKGEEEAPLSPPRGGPRVYAGREKEERTVEYSRDRVGGHDDDAMVAQAGALVVRGPGGLAEPWVLTPSPEQFPHCRELNGHKLGAAGAVDLAHKISIKVTFGVVRPGCCARAEELNLGYNFIRPKGCIAVCLALKGGGCPHIRVLNLQGNEIGIDGTRAVCDVMTNGGCQHLSTLNLRDNHLTDEAGRQLGSALYARPPCCRTLKEINLRNNLLGLPGAMLLIKAVKSGVAPNFDVLNLRDNRISVAGRRRLGQSLPTFLAF